MTARARAGVSFALAASVLFVPSTAMAQSAAVVAYRVVGGTRAERRSIKVGVIRNGRVEVSEGLAVGDQVVVRGQDQLVDGSPVSLRDPSGAPAAEPPVAAAATAESARP